MTATFKKYILPGFALIAGIVGFFLRNWLFAEAQGGLLPEGHIAGNLSLLMLAAVLAASFFMAWKMEPSKDYVNMFPRSAIASVGIALGAVGMGCTVFAVEAKGVFGLLLPALAVVGTGALLSSAFFRFRGDRPHCLAYGLFTLYLIVYTLSCCRVWGAEPQLHLYLFPLLALLFLLIACYYRAELTVRMDNCRRYVFFSQAALFCCCVSVQGTGWPFYLSGAIWLAADSCSLTFPKKEQKQEQEEEKQLKEQMKLEAKQKKEEEKRQKEQLKLEAKQKQEEEKRQQEQLKLEAKQKQEEEKRQQEQLKLESKQKQEEEKRQQEQLKLEAKQKQEEGKRHHEQLKLEAKQKQEEEKRQQEQLKLEAKQKQEEEKRQQEQLKLEAKQKQEEEKRQQEQLKLEAKQKQEEEKRQQEQLKLEAKQKQEEEKRQQEQLKLEAKQKKEEEKQKQKEEKQKQKEEKKRKRRQPKMALPWAVAFCMETLERAGFEAYAVGGCVRDTLLGLNPHDYDLCTNARPEETAQLFAEHTLVRSGEKHGTIGVVVDSQVVEITTYRTEGGYQDNRHPDWVEFVSSVQEDLSRRDFTINAMAYNPRIGYVDPFGGQEDLENQILRTVGDPRERFAEDALRILRGIRFAVRFAVKPEDDTLQAMKELAPSMERLAKERVFDELCKILPLITAEDLLLYKDVFVQVLPVLAPCVDFDQKSPWHAYDIYTHIAYVVEATPPSLAMRWAALLHDCGKPGCFQLDDEGKGHFYGHAEISEKLAEETLLELKAPTALRKQACFLIAHHMTPVEPDKRQVRRRLSQYGEESLRQLLVLQRADAVGTGIERDLSGFGEVFRLLEEVLSEGDCLTLKNLAVNGEDLQELGFTPGPELGACLDRLLERVQNEELPNEKEALLAAAKECL